MRFYIKSTADTVLSARSGENGNPKILFVKEKEDVMIFLHLYQIHELLIANKELFATAIDNGQEFAVLDLDTDQEVMEADFIEKIVKK